MNGLKRSGLALSGKIQAKTPPEVKTTKKNQINIPFEIPGPGSRMIPKSHYATYGVGGVKERGMEVEREGGGQYQALPKGMFPTTVKVNVHREASLDV